jgi:plastocyanin
VPADNKWATRVTFTEPGTYVLRCQAHDGGLSASEDVTFVVTR